MRFAVASDFPKAGFILDSRPEAELELHCLQV